MKTREQKNAETVAAFIEEPSNQGLLEKTGQLFVPHIAEAFTDRRYSVEEILAHGEKVIARIAMTAVHSGHFAGHAPTGRTVKATQFREFRVTDGTITEHWGWFDTGTLLPQIAKGAV
ncbi:ester cyclase [Paenibacillus mucilaginosus]|uniref:SnoaL-like polyketide cyclase n=1 Tax=Paenibacillus mucilaginosus (strain KNP414) TaxID=1036673 RepID=F8FJA9_PAEMK|nr:ester cyclase [Paenibacillus mucilaginosus]AEI39872.1 protein of unknown function DUF1486 [Paenibacillus mucilaginosus KNP414]MCG7217193.1 ester cyclase [Paenibacillus mucilaginosus]WDM29151.1 ester cyclase [Paenibacillus mucilaginosus]